MSACRRDKSEFYWVSLSCNDTRPGRASSLKHQTESRWKKNTAFKLVYICVGPYSHDSCDVQEERSSWNSSTPPCWACTFAWFWRTGRCCRRTQSPTTPSSRKSVEAGCRNILKQFPSPGRNNNNQWLAGNIHVCSQIFYLTWHCTMSKVIYLAWPKVET